MIVPFSDAVATIAPHAETASAARADWCAANEQSGASCAASKRST